MSKMLNIAETTINTLKSLTDIKGPLHIGEAMSCWIYNPYLDGLLLIV